MGGRARRVGEPGDAVDLGSPRRAHGFVGTIGTGIRDRQRHNQRNIEQTLERLTPG
jgi:hypothetical protein